MTAPDAPAPSGLGDRRALREGNQALDDVIASAGLTLRPEARERLRRAIDRQP